MVEQDNWTEMMDIISELEVDLGQNRRGLRHLNNLRQAIHQVEGEIRKTVESVPKKRKLF